MQLLLVAFGSTITTHQASLMARNGVLMCLNTPIILVAISSNAHIIRARMAGKVLLFPSKRKIGGGDDLHEVHVVVRRLTGFFLSVVQRVDVMVCPWQCLRAHLLRNLFWQLRSKAEVMDLVREYVASFHRRIEVVIQVVYVHVAVAETPSWGNVEVTDDLVDSDTSFNTASLLSL